TRVTKVDGVQHISELNIMTAEPYKRLAKLVARAFYDDIPTRGENQPKSGRSDNRGMAVVVLDALTRRQWVKEDDLAKDLKLHSKQLRRTLRFFEEERLITRDHRRETAKGAKVFNAAVAATADGQQNGKEGEEKMKLHTHSYCCLDYAQIYDVVRYRIHRMKKRLKDELEDRNTLQEYICPNCNRRYSALDALQLISMTSDGFHCENCNSELVAESDKLAAEEKGDGEDNGRRRRREKLRELLEKMEVGVQKMRVHSAQSELPKPRYASARVQEKDNDGVEPLDGIMDKNPNVSISIAQATPIVQDVEAEHIFHSQMRSKLMILSEDCKKLLGPKRAIGARDVRNSKKPKHQVRTTREEVKKVIVYLFMVKMRANKGTSSHFCRFTGLQSRFPKVFQRAKSSGYKEQLKPLMEQLARVKDLPVPEYGSLLQWEARAIAAGRSVSGDNNANESSKSSQGQGYGGTPMPYLGETKVEVALSGMEIKADDSKDNVSVKVLPPWMIKQGMNLTDEQRGEMKHELKPDIGSSFAGPVADRKPGDDKGGVDQSLQEEYIKAYYAAIFKQQQQAEGAAAATTEEASSERRVGMKGKREEEDDEAVEWEDTPIA
ncbi:hypothetical protein KI387_006189, partial [Taxus chinensis]